MRASSKGFLLPTVRLALSQLSGNGALFARAQGVEASAPQAQSRFADGGSSAGPESAEYQRVQRRLAQGWNTWDVRIFHAG